MTISDHFRNQLLERVSLATVIGKSVNWDARKSQPAKGDFWACCPFHNEKTPSFHVDDRKGVYYCFGCHEKGNAISFLRSTRNLGFRESVEVLAGMVGMTVPQPDPRAKEKADRESQIQAVCEESARYFQEALQSASGTETRNYLAGRGVSDKTRQTFRLGFAPAGNTLLKYLRGKGFSEQLMLDSGMVARSEERNELYDRFRGRLMFPINDLRGRVIAFGGRVMGSTSAAKYLNSSETEIFKKGTCLFNHGPARNAAGQDDRLVVVEGYMDVLMLQQAGLECCVAPLGTAITDTQLRMLWRVSAEPVLAMDGDTAGLNAAERLARLAMPMLEPGKSLGFCVMPEGKDPDDVIRQFGVKTMRQMLKQAMPLAQFVWQCESRRRTLTTPESRAELEAALMRAAESVRDPTVKRHYRTTFRSLINDAGKSTGRRGGDRRGQSGYRRGQTDHSPSFELRSSLLAKAAPGRNFERQLRETVVLGVCLSVPEVVGRCIERLEGLEMTAEPNALVLGSLIRNHALIDRGHDEFWLAIADEVGQARIDDILSSGHLQALQIAIEESDGRRGRVDSAVLALREEIDKLTATTGAQEELLHARNEIEQQDAGNSTARVAEAVRTREQARRGPDSLDTGDFTLAPNGVRVKIDEIREFEAICDGGSPGPVNE